jgi:FkbM family methyltransferase
MLPNNHDKVILDLGANIGVYTLLVKKHCEHCRVIAVEPEPLNSLLLEKNVKINNLRDVIIVRKAISDEEGTAKLYLSQYDVSHSIVEPVGKKYIVIETTTIDKLLEEFGIEKVDLIKMDVEGAEYKALRGAIKSIQKGVKLSISVEHDPLIKIECIKFLINNGYKVIDKGECIHAYVKKVYRNS